MKRVSVIIPTLNAEKDLPALLDALKRQKHHIDEIIVVDSASTDNTVAICKQYGSKNDRNSNVKLLQINRKDFDHGRTRDMALRKSIGDIVVFLTQDAIPANEDCIGNLIQHLTNCDDNSVAISTGRQLPKKDATRIEKLIRNFNYPLIDDMSSCSPKTGGGVLPTI